MLLSALLSAISMPCVQILGLASPKVRPRRASGYLRRRTQRPCLLSQACQGRAFLAKYIDGVTRSRGVVVSGRVPLDTLLEGRQCGKCYHCYVLLIMPIRVLSVAVVGVDHLAGHLGWQRPNDPVDFVNLMFFFVGGSGITCCSNVVLCMPRLYKLS